YGKADETHTKIFLSECAWQASRGIRTKEYKFIRTFDSGVFERPDRELYDLTSDPNEIKNVAKVNLEKADQLEKELNQWVFNKIGDKEDPIEVVLQEQGLPFRKRIEKILN